MASSKGPILITGASGFVGGHILREALERGYTVRAAARSESSAKKIGALFPQYADKISYVIVPNMTVIEDYEAAFKPGDLSGVIHVASPFVLQSNDVKRDLLDPAVNGTLSILEAAHRYGGGAIKRVVVTSSHAANLDMSKGLRPGHVYNEDDWNPMTYDEAAVADAVTAYCASKALAERAMWKWVADHKPGFDTVAITPPWIFGPYATELKSTKGLSESMEALYRLLGSSKIRDPDFCAFADVREVATAHLQALEVPEAGGQRFWVGQEFNWQRAADAIRAALPELKLRIPEGTPGVWPEMYSVDGSKAARVLGLKYRPLQETMKDSYLQLPQAEKAEAAAAA